MRRAGVELHDLDIPMPWDVDICRYHVHKDTPVCERKTPAVVDAEVEEAEKPRKLRKINTSSSLPFRSASAAIGGQKASPRQKKNARN